MELNDSSRAAGSSHPAIPRSVFPGSLGKLLPLPAAQVPTRLSPPRQQANAAESADTAAESADTVPRAATAPASNQRCFVSVSPGRIFLPGLDSPSSSPCSSKNLRCRFSPTNPQLLKSALPIFPLVGMAAAAPLSGPTVFSVKPWTVNRPDS